MIVLLVLAFIFFMTMGTGCAYGAYQYLQAVDRYNTQVKRLDRLSDRI